MGDIFTAESVDLEVAVALANEAARSDVAGEPAQEVGADAPQIAPKIGAAVEDSQVATADSAGKDGINITVRDDSAEGAVDDKTAMVSGSSSEVRLTAINGGNKNTASDGKRVLSDKQRFLGYYLNNRNELCREITYATVLDRECRSVKFVPYVQGATEDPFAMIDRMVLAKKETKVLTEPDIPALKQEKEALKANIIGMGYTEQIAEAALACGNLDSAVAALQLSAGSYKLNGKFYRRPDTTYVDSIGVRYVDHDTKYQKKTGVRYIDSLQGYYNERARAQRLADMKIVRKREVLVSYVPLKGGRATPYTPREQKPEFIGRDKMTLRTAPKRWNVAKVAIQSYEIDARNGVSRRERRALARLDRGKRVVVRQTAEELAQSQQKAAEKKLKRVLAKKELDAQRTRSAAGVVRSNAKNAKKQNATKQQVTRFETLLYKYADKTVVVPFDEGLLDDDVKMSVVLLHADTQKRQTSHVRATIERVNKKISAAVRQASDVEFYKAGHPTGRPMERPIKVKSCPKIHDDDLARVCADATADLMALLKVASGTKAAGDSGISECSSGSELDDEPITVELSKSKKRDQKARRLRRSAHKVQLMAKALEEQELLDAAIATSQAAAEMREQAIECETNGVVVGTANKRNLMPRASVIIGGVYFLLDNRSAENHCAPGTTGFELIPNKPGYVQYTAANAHWKGFKNEFNTCYGSNLIGRSSLPQRVIGDLLADEVYVNGPSGKVHFVVRRAKDHFHQVKAVITGADSKVSAFECFVDSGATSSLVEANMYYSLRSCGFDVCQITLRRKGQNTVTEALRIVNDAGQYGYVVNRDHFADCHENFVAANVLFLADAKLTYTVSELWKATEDAPGEFNVVNESAIDSVVDDQGVVPEDFTELTTPREPTGRESSTDSEAYYDVEESELKDLCESSSSSARTVTPVQLPDGPTGFIPQPDKVYVSAFPPYTVCPDASDLTVADETGTKFRFVYDPAVTAITAEKPPNVAFMQRVGDGNIAWMDTEGKLHSRVISEPTKLYVAKTPDEFHDMFKVITTRIWHNQRVINDLSDQNGELNSHLNYFACSVKEIMANHPAVQDGTKLKELEERLAAQQAEYDTKLRAMQKLLTDKESECEALKAVNEAMIEKQRQDQDKYDSMLELHTAERLATAAEAEVLVTESEGLRKLCCHLRDQVASTTVECEIALADYRAQLERLTARQYSEAQTQTMRQACLGVSIQASSIHDIDGAVMVDNSTDTLEWQEQANKAIDTLMSFAGMRSKKNVVSTSFIKKVECTSEPVKIVVAVDKQPEVPHLAVDLTVVKDMIVPTAIIAEPETIESEGTTLMESADAISSPPMSFTAESTRELKMETVDVILPTAVQTAEVSLVVVPFTSDVTVTSVASQAPLEFRPTETEQINHETLVQPDMDSHVNALVVNGSNIAAVVTEGLEQTNEPPVQSELVDHVSAVAEKVTFITQMPADVQVIPMVTEDIDCTVGETDAASQDAVGVVSESTIATTLVSIAREAAAEGGATAIIQDEPAEVAQKISTVVPLAAEAPLTVNDRSSSPPKPQRVPRAYKTAQAELQAKYNIVLTKGQWVATNDTNELENRPKDQKKAIYELMAEVQYKQLFDLGFKIEVCGNDKVFLVSKLVGTAQRVIFLVSNLDGARFGIWSKDRMLKSYPAGSQLDFIAGLMDDGWGVVLANPEAALKGCRYGKMSEPAIQQLPNISAEEYMNYFYAQYVPATYTHYRVIIFDSVKWLDKLFKDNAEMLTDNVDRVIAFGKEYFIPAALRAWGKERFMLLTAMKGRTVGDVQRRSAYNVMVSAEADANLFLKTTTVLVEDLISGVADEDLDGEMEYSDAESSDADDNDTDDDENGSGSEQEHREGHSSFWSAKCDSSDESEDVDDQEESIPSEPESAKPQTAFLKDKKHRRQIRAQNSRSASKQTNLNQPLPRTQQPLERVEEPQEVADLLGLEDQRLLEKIEKYKQMLAAADALATEYAIIFATSLDALYASPCVSRYIVGNDVRHVRLMTILDELFAEIMNADSKLATKYGVVRWPNLTDSDEETAQNWYNANATTVSIQVNLFKHLISLGESQNQRISELVLAGKLDAEIVEMQERAQRLLGRITANYNMLTGELASLPALVAKWERGEELSNHPCYNAILEMTRPSIRNTICQDYEAYYAAIVFLKEAGVGQCSLMSLPVFMVGGTSFNDMVVAWLGYYEDSTRPMSTIPESPESSIDASSTTSSTVPQEHPGTPSVDSRTASPIAEKPDSPLVNGMELPPRPAWYCSREPRVAGIRNPLLRLYLLNVDRLPNVRYKFADGIRDMPEDLLILSAHNGTYVKEEIRSVGKRFFHLKCKGTVKPEIDTIRGHLGTTRVIGLFIDLNATKFNWQRTLSQLLKGLVDTIYIVSAVLSNHVPDKVQVVIPMNSDDRVPECAYHQYARDYPHVKLEIFNANMATINKVNVTINMSRDQAGAPNSVLGKCTMLVKEKRDSLIRFIGVRQFALIGPMWETYQLSMEMIKAGYKVQRYMTDCEDYEYAELECESNEVDEYLDLSACRPEDDQSVSCRIYPGRGALRTFARRIIDFIYHDVPDYVLPMDVQFANVIHSGNNLVYIRTYGNDASYNVANHLLTVSKNMRVRAYKELQGKNVRFDIDERYNDVEQGEALRLAIAIAKMSGASTFCVVLRRPYYVVSLNKELQVREYGLLVDCGGGSDKYLAMVERNGGMSAGTIAAYRARAEKYFYDHEHHRGYRRYTGETFTTGAAQTLTLVFGKDEYVDRATEYLSNIRSIMLHVQYSSKCCRVLREGAKLRYTECESNEVFDPFMDCEEQYTTAGPDTQSEDNPINQQRNARRIPFEPSRPPTEQTSRQFRQQPTNQQRSVRKPIPPTDDAALIRIRRYVSGISKCAVLTSNWMGGLPTVCYSHRLSDLNRLRSSEVTGVTGEANTLLGVLIEIFNDSLKDNKYLSGFVIAIMEHIMKDHDIDPSAYEAMSEYKWAMYSILFSYAVKYSDALQKCPMEGEEIEALARIKQVTAAIGKANHDWKVVKHLYVPRLFANQSEVVNRYQALKDDATLKRTYYQHQVLSTSSFLLGTMDLAKDERMSFRFTHDLSVVHIVKYRQQARVGYAQADIPARQHLRTVLEPKNDTEPTVYQKVPAAKTVPIGFCADWDEYVKQRKDGKLVNYGPGRLMGCHSDVNRGMEWYFRNHDGSEHTNVDACATCTFKQVIYICMRKYCHVHKDHCVYMVRAGSKYLFMKLPQFAKLEVNENTDAVRLLTTCCDYDTFEQGEAKCHKVTYQPHESEAYVARDGVLYDYDAQNCIGERVNDPLSSRLLRSFSLDIRKKTNDVSERGANVDTDDSGDDNPKDYWVAGRAINKDEEQTVDYEGVRCRTAIHSDVAAMQLHVWVRDDMDAKATNYLRGLTHFPYDKDMSLHLPAGFHIVASKDFAGFTQKLGSVVRDNDVKVIYFVIISKERPTEEMLTTAAKYYEGLDAKMYYLLSQRKVHEYQTRLERAAYYESERRLRLERRFEQQSAPRPTVSAPIQRKDSVIYYLPPGYAELRKELNLPEFKVPADFDIRWPGIKFVDKANNLTHTAPLTGAVVIPGYSADPLEMIPLSIDGFGIGYKECDGKMREYLLYQTPAQLYVAVKGIYENKYCKYRITKLDDLLNHLKPALMSPRGKDIRQIIMDSINSMQSGYGVLYRTLIVGEVCRVLCGYNITVSMMTKEAKAKYGQIMDLVYGRYVTTGVKICTYCGNIMEDPYRCCGAIPKAYDNPTLYVDKEGAKYYNAASGRTPLNPVTGKGIPNQALTVTFTNDKGVANFVQDYARNACMLDVSQGDAMKDWLLPAEERLYFDAQRVRVGKSTVFDSVFKNPVSITATEAALYDKQYPDKGTKTPNEEQNKPDAPNAKARTITPEPKVGPPEVSKANEPTVRADDKDTKVDLASDAVDDEDSYDVEEVGIAVDACIDIDFGDEETF